MVSDDEKSSAGVPLEPLPAQPDYSVSGIELPPQVETGAPLTPPYTTIGQINALNSNPRRVRRTLALVLTWAMVGIMIAGILFSALSDWFGTSSTRAEDTVFEVLKVLVPLVSLVIGYFFGSESKSDDT